MAFTEHPWTAISPIYDAILALPFSCSAYRRETWLP
jgi:hypothetical protein